MDRNEDRFKLVNLKNRADVLDQITQTERELNRLLDTDVALIAYVKDDDGPDRAEG